MKPVRFIISAVVLGVLVTPLLLFAQGEAPKGVNQVRKGLNEALEKAEIPGKSTLAETTANRGEELASIMGTIINIAVGILGAVTFLFILYAGYLWFTAKGNDEQVVKAKDIFADAVIGLVLILVSGFLASLVLRIFTR